jgi:hypothetical protein
MVLYISALSAVIVLTVFGTVAAPEAYAESPELLADLGGGTTELREISVRPPEGHSDFMEAAASAGAVSRVGDMRIRYKLYTLLGEPVFDALLYWELDDRLSANHGLYFEPDFYPGLEDKWRTVGTTASLGMSGDRTFIPRTRLQSFPELVRRFDRIKPTEVIVTAEIGIEGVSRASSSRLSLADPTQPSHRRLRPRIDIAIDLPAGNGSWQRLSVPGSPSWEDLDPDVKRLFAARRPDEDIVIYEAWLKEIVWQDSAIHSLASSYLDREVRAAEAELSDDDFWGSPDGSLEPEDVPGREPGTTSAERQAARHAQRVERSSREQAERYERVRATESPIDVQILADSDGSRSFRVDVSESLSGTTVVFLDADGTEIGGGGEVRDSTSFTVRGTIPMVHFYRNGELIARYQGLSDPDYVTGEVRVYMVPLRYSWSFDKDPEDEPDWDRLDGARPRGLRVNGHRFNLGGESWLIDRYGGDVWEPREDREAGKLYLSFDIYDYFGTDVDVQIWFEAADGDELSLEADRISIGDESKMNFGTLTRYSFASNDVRLLDVVEALNGAASVERDSVPGLGSVLITQRLAGEHIEDHVGSVTAVTNYATSPAQSGGRLELQLAEDGVRDRRTGEPLNSW